MRRTTGAAARRVSSPCPGPETAWLPLPRALQEADRTPARQARPREWLRAMAWMTGSGLHPRACATTTVVAQDLASRMDFTKGTVLYDLDGTALRCRVSTATVKRHVRVLRELGLLAWVRHGSRQNLHLPGRPYAGTATIYAATIPLPYDEARARRPVDNPPTHRATSTARAPQSPGRHHPVRKAEVSGRENYTAHGRRSPFQVARDIVIARQVRPLVGWTQREGLRRLAFALRPLIDRGLDARRIAAELQGIALGWRPARPAAYIAAALARQNAEEEAREADDHVRDPAANVAWQAWLRLRDGGPAADEPARTDDDRRRARLHGWDRWAEAATHYADSPDDALDLYGTRLCCYAVKRAARWADR